MALGTPKQVLYSVVNMIEKLPPADVSEIKNCRNDSSIHPVDEFICSECGLIMRDLTEVKIDEDANDEAYYEFEFNYCPKCGAKIVEV